MKTILIITDGIGYNKNENYNAFFHAKKPTYDKLFKEVPFGMIETFGLSVGLPEGQMGNSEVGHMSLGSGRILYQDLVKINKAIEENTLMQNKALTSLKSCKRVHLIGLMSDGGVHSHLNHILALAHGLESQCEVLLHLITDGRDVLPKSAPYFLNEIENAIQGKNICIASISGRYFAMDRDNRWERVELAYNTIALGENPQNISPQEYLQAQFSKEIFDEFIEPASFSYYNGIQNTDGIIFVNFRSDRAREIVSALGNVEFSGFKRKKFTKIPLLTMTPYDKTFTFPILFPKETIKNTLAEVISKHNLRQFHTAETEKYAHVTFFFNGGVEEPQLNETRLLVPSPKVKTYDLQPEMSAKEVSNAVLNAMDSDYDFIVVNFANGDMVGHTGNYEAAIKAVEAVDLELGRIYTRAKELGYGLVITSDHGNCEAMKDEKGEALTNHTIGSVWCFVAANGVKAVKNGGLNNIAPSILKLMDLEIPSEMDAPLF
ncbi:2,3-bisphosphoglycerate-independent phosphoglycerate mutase [Helicobacter turcicus]|uniref:2,3-bisphosphoglycerate-independent phosphoglycerate mutase n=1 Tax=Helicobacter turcicus TaxID=2867412 RepID=A0ABS7JP11_9HELI|nr:2,3-bisphosphoglycerate-independent phosphoglycerate mutase [Helicobacter turcicus]MBX7491112.1 2,3-bisphosphoglycerate-independent phosphoglycerate mutase [Helicobacter turcicus]MBX7545976.1 2,3-bisphosphoglycerate-independent phosphoglycerate mutase [Helicobacter turcicus]